MEFMKRLLLLSTVAGLALLAPQLSAQTTGTGTGSGTTTTPSSGLGSSGGLGTIGGLGGRHRGGAEGVERRAREIIAKYDKDGDHALNATELAAFFEAVHQRVEERHEQAGSAITTSAASTTGTTATGHHGTPLEHAQKAIAKFDKNGDGKLEARELAAMLMAMRERLEHRGQGGANNRVAPTTTPAAPPQS